jgi:hypothetical protein
MYHLLLMVVMQHTVKERKYKKERKEEWIDV